jgi:hypothetical protein
MHHLLFRHIESRILCHFFSIMQAEAHLANGLQDKNKEGLQYPGTKLLIINLQNTSSEREHFQQWQRDC